MNYLRAAKAATLEKVLPYILIIGGGIGLLSALIIMLDKLALLKDATYTPACDLNPVVSCGSVMASNQSNAFGFPNPIIGLFAFGVLITIGMGLLAGARFKRWFWIGLQLGTIFGVGFVHWLFFQTVYRINALCPYCMAVWVVTITTFWYVLLYNLKTKNVVIPGKLGDRISTFIQAHHLDILVLWFVIIVGLILKHFWYYFGRNF
jgi:uncharacterized membrane protein